MYIYGLIVPILSFLLQIWPRIKNRYFGVDTWRFLMISDYIRKNKKLPTSVPQYIISTPFAYPPVLITILAFFPKKFLEKYQFLVSPLIDMVNNFIIFSVAFYLTNDLKTAIFAQLIAALTPVIVMEASSLTARIFSHLLFYLSFLPLIFFTDNIYWIILAAIILVILFYSHKLAIQAYLFSAIAFSIVERNPFYLIFFLGVFLAVFFLGGKSYKLLLEDHIAVLRYFIKYIDLRFAHQFRGIQKVNKNKDFINKLYSLSFKNPYVYILGNNPWIGIFLVISFLGYFKLINITSLIPHVELFKLNIWIYALLIVALATLAIKKIRFLGEGNRYIEYAVLPVSIILGSYFSLFWTAYGWKFIMLFIAAAILLLIAIIYIQRKAILHDKARTITPDLWKIIDHLNSYKKEELRMAFFPNTLGDPIMYFIKAKALLTDGGKGMHELKDLIPVVSRPMSEIVEKYDLNYILIEESYVTFEELKLKRYIEARKFGSYILIKL